MKKNIIVMKLEILHVIILATTACLLTACSSEEYLGAPPEVGATGNAISFNGETGRMTRATLNGQAAADKLGRNFVVYGFKDDQVVYDCYNVNYTANTGHSTVTNAYGWEYVGQTISPLSSLPAGAEQDIKYWDMAASQYDFIAFSAGASPTVSLVKTTPGANELQFSPINKANLTSAAYTVTGKTADMMKLYISDRYTASASASASASPIANHQGVYKDAVQFSFRSLPAKVRLGFYETIPGYSVRDVEFFYSDASDTPTMPLSSPVLTAETACMPDESTVMTVKYPTTNASDADFNRAHVTFAGTTESPLTKIVTLAETNILPATLVTGENNEDAETTTGAEFLGRSSSSASMTDFSPVMPYEDGTPLTLKVNYTLVSTDGQCGDDTPVVDGADQPVIIPGETITVHGATAVIPKEFAKWQSNFAYTYLFKISDNTNGLTKPGIGAAGLYPISFTAVVTQDDFGTQETVTTLAKPSITSYQKGKQVGGDTNIAYSTGLYIYICLENPAEEKLTADNTRLLKVSIDDGAKVTFEEYKRIKDAGTMSQEAFNELSEDLKKRLYTESYVTDLVANYSPSGDVYTSPTDAAGKKMTATVTSLLEKVTEIALDDAPYGQAVKGNFMRFKPTESGYYAFEYTIVCSTVDEYNGYHPKKPAIDASAFAALSDAEKAVHFYKIIKVEAPTPPTP